MYKQYITVASDRSPATRTSIHSGDEGTALLQCAVDQRTINCHVFDTAESRRMLPLRVCPLTRDMTFWKGTKDVGDAKERMEEDEMGASEKSLRPAKRTDSATLQN